MEIKQNSSDKIIDAHAKEFASGLSHLPPLFSTSFSKNDISWKSLERVDYDIIGRILVSHLCIETYINKYIELRLPKTFDLESANLTFSQKLKTLKKDFATMPLDFYTGINIINKIRNRYSHNLESKIEASEIGIIRGLLKEYYSNKSNSKSKIRSSKLPTDSSNADVASIQQFTNLFCAFIAGACTVVAKIG